MLGALPWAGVARSHQWPGGIKSSARIKCSVSPTQDVGDTIRHISVTATLTFYGHVPDHIWSPAVTVADLARNIMQTSSSTTLPSTGQPWGRQATRPKIQPPRITGHGDGLMQRHDPIAAVGRSGCSLEYGSATWRHIGATTSRIGDTTKRMDHKKRIHGHEMSRSA
jgi:hypothetical protein